MTGSTMTRCGTCTREFEVRFRYQTRDVSGGSFAYACSHRCLQQQLASECVCEVCSSRFELEFPYQAVAQNGAQRYFCTEVCRARGLAPKVAAPTPAPRRTRRIAVFNHKGGTGKTTTAISIAAGFAESGQKVLLIDADAQGNVGASLGIRGSKSLYHVLVHGMNAEDAVVPVRNNLDVLTSNETLAAAELHLAGLPNRHRVMRERLGARVSGYDVVVIDCAPALSLMNQNALVYADGLIVPVACDYLSLVGVKQVLKTVKNVRKLLNHDVQLLGVVPTFYDGRNKISADALEALRKHFGDRCFAPIRVNTKLKEAPSVKKTIFEHAPKSRGALDYQALVEMMMTPVEAVVRKGAAA